MFFRRKTKENHTKSVQNVRKLVFSLGKTKEDGVFPRKNQGKATKKKDPSPPKKKDQKKNPPLEKRGRGTGRGRRRWRLATSPARSTPCMPTCSLAHCDSYLLRLLAVILKPETCDKSTGKSQRKSQLHT